MPTFVIERDYVLPCRVTAEIAAETEPEAIAKLDRAIDRLREHVERGERYVGVRLYEHEVEEG